MDLKVRLTKELSDKLNEHVSANPHLNRSIVARMAIDSYLGGAEKVKKATPSIKKEIKYFTEEAFNTFWDMYPSTKRKTNKVGTKDKFQKIKGATVVQILDGLKMWKNDIDWTKEGGKFIPAPTVFINKRMWEAGIKQTKKKTIWTIDPSTGRQVSKVIDA